MDRLFAVPALLVLAACSGGSTDAVPSNQADSGVPEGLPLDGGSSGSSTSSGGADGSGGTPPASKLVIATTWQELDAEQSRPLASDTEDCFAAGFNLKAAVALLPASHDDTLRTDKAPGGQWTFEKDEAVHVTFTVATDLTKATCSAPVKGSCPSAGDGPCRVASPPTIKVEGTASWSIAGGAAHGYTGVLVASPIRIQIDSSDREQPVPAGWTGNWVQYTYFVDGDGVAGIVDSTGCSPCSDYVQRNAAFPPARSVSTRSR